MDPLAPRWALWRYGRLIHVKGDFNQTSDVASNRKTWHAMIVGAAILQGKIPSLEDMGRLGLLACARGNWNGRQLVPEWFVRELETKQTRGMKVNYDGPNDGKIGLDPAEYPEAPYGYLTWVNTDGDLYPGADRARTCARGAGGHITLWNHKLGIVFAAAGWFRPPRERDVPQIIEANLGK